MLFAGTGNAFYYSMDDGASWKQFRDGLPAAPVSWIVVQKQYHDVVVSTYGRGIYILSDITPLEQGVMDPTFSEAAHLVAPRPTFREVRAGRAEISYVLKAAPKSPIEVEVLDAKGALVRKLPPVSTAHPGLNRLNWDMHYEAPRTVALRTTPPENPHIWEEPRFNPNGQQQDTRAITHWGWRRPKWAPSPRPASTPCG